MIFISLCDDAQRLTSTAAADLTGLGRVILRQLLQPGPQEHALAVCLVRQAATCLGCALGIEAGSQALRCTECFALVHLACAPGHEAALAACTGRPVAAAPSETSSAASSTPAEANGSLGQKERLAELEAENERLRAALVARSHSGSESQTPMATSPPRVNVAASPLSPNRRRRLGSEDDIDLDVFLPARPSVPRRVVSDVFPVVRRGSNGSTPSVSAASSQENVAFGRVHSHEMPHAASNGAVAGSPQASSVAPAVYDMFVPPKPELSNVAFLKDALARRAGGSTRRQARISRMSVDSQDSSGSLNSSGDAAMLQAMGMGAASSSLARSVPSPSRPPPAYSAVEATRRPHASPSRHNGGAAASPLAPRSTSPPVARAIFANGRLR